MKTQSLNENQTPAEKRASMTWAERLKRVFDIDIETRSENGGDVRVITSIEEPVVIRKVLDHLEARGALARSCQFPSCRAPPELDLETML